jgi:hypothetical protein
MDMDIIFSSVNLPAITINDDYNSYQITTEECRGNHILTLKSTKFIAVKHHGAIHIFNLKNDGKFTEDFKTHIEKIKPQLVAYFNHKPRDFFEIERHKREIKKYDPTNKYEFEVIEPRECQQTEVLDLSNAKKKIEKLNIILQQTCPHFYMRIDYLTSFPPNSNIRLFDGMLEHLNSFYTSPYIILCLFTGNDCVSSITMYFMHSFAFAPGELELSIDSKTKKLYERRKFNKLLTAVSIIISKDINPDIHTLTSTAINAISASVMIKSFNAVYVDDKNNKISKSTSSSDEIDKLIETSNIFNVKTYVELNTDNIENATRVFREIIQTKDTNKRIKCDKLQDETAVHSLAPAQDKTELETIKPRIVSQPDSRLRYYRRLGINFERGGNQTKKRSDHKRSGRKRSGRKRSGRKRSGHKRTYKLK